MEYVRFVFAAFMALAAGSALATDAVGKLRHFVASARSAEGEFQQTVIGESGRPPQRMAGKFAFSRPGKFRWEYESPYPQLLVGDGNKLWSWDHDLNQVTVRPLGNALGATPAAILFGQGELERDFALAEGAANGTDEAGLELVWVEARPRVPANAENGGGGFQLIRFGFSGASLQRMVLHDSFGQTTVVAFSRLRLNPQLDPGIFHFEAPAGADILGDPSPP
ncbi:MAG: outer membrane lipoprotein chaperone LolA [Azoarcus sp.]|jgi:outer membrane lipoprotein carrier protein|nr:outer membrane lipoprotein chaperone LolA [Azoarcus sp.]